jgi:hypothetical protein
VIRVVVELVYAHCVSRRAVHPNECMTFARRIARNGKVAEIRLSPITAYLPRARAPRPSAVWTWKRGAA